MCGVVGYIGKSFSRAIVLEGLEKLEYRGYDSAGFACLDESSQLVAIKTIGYLSNLKQKLQIHPFDGHIGIGHTRWATHGEISDVNAHPQFDCFSRVAVVHNGIIENHLEIKEELIKRGHKFVSGTDTEVVAHLCEHLSQEHFKQELLNVIQPLKGAYACMIIHESMPHTLIAVRKGSPLCIGIDTDQFFVASDPYAFAQFTKRALFVPDESMTVISGDQLEIYDFNGHKLMLEPVTLDIDLSNSEKAGFEHYMLKEIYEQKNAIQATLSYCKNLKDQIWQQLHVTQEELSSLRSISFIGCGTSWHAGRIAQFFFEQVAQLPTKVVLASEFRYSSFFPESHCWYVGISQSGETVDTLECIRMINRYKLKTFALSNVALSSMTRETSGHLLTKAGQEIAVASTKAFSTQLAVLFWLAHRIAYERRLITESQYERAHDDLLVAAEVLENSIEGYRRLIQQELASFYAQFKRFIFLGRHISYPFAMEAALKLKEVSYIFSQCYPAGELKHGPIALLDNDTPVVLFSSLDEQIYQKILSSAQEVKARKAHMLVFAFEGQDELLKLADNSFILPRVNPLLMPLAMTGLMQVWVYEIAKVLGCTIDRPRNLAKSVTVE